MTKTRLVKLLALIVATASGVSSILVGDIYIGLGTLSAGFASLSAITEG